MAFEQLLAVLMTLPQKFLVKTCELLHLKYRKYHKHFEKTGSNSDALPDELKDIIHIPAD